MQRSLRLPVVILMKGGKCCILLFPAQRRKCWSHEFGRQIRRHYQCDQDGFFGRAFLSEDRLLGEKGLLRGRSGPFFCTALPVTGQESRRLGPAAVFHCTGGRRVFAVEKRKNCMGICGIMEVIKRDRM